ncbi:MAG: SurA N-terminal domain-containing protein [Synergistaceae bacterium]|nr:SurA N-terminal domain-containing protein [Synergistaceae bacterium]
MMKFLRTQMKWIMAVIVVAFLLSTFLMYEGRSTRRSPGPRNADGTMEDYEVAIINGRSLMRSELEQRLRNYLNNYSTRSTISLDIAAIYQTVLNQAVLDSQMAKEVQEKGITVTDAEADRAMKTYADTYFPTREAFYQILNNSGITIEDYRKSLARQMANERLVRQAVGEVVVSEDKAVEFYDTMKNFIYSRPEGFMLQVANFNSNKAAEDMIARINSGQSWVNIVSNDELASKDVINITREPVFLPSSAMRSGMLSVLASVDIGKISPVINISSTDFAVALKTEHVDASLTPYNEVSADIKAMLRNQEERKRLSDFEAELMSKAQVVINDKSLFARPVVSQDNKPEPEQEFEITEIEEVSEDSEPESESESESEPELESGEQEIEITEEVIDVDSEDNDSESESESELELESGEVEIEVTPESGEPVEVEAEETEIEVLEEPESQDDNQEHEILPETAEIQESSLTSGDNK